MSCYTCKKQKNTLSGETPKIENEKPSIFQKTKKLISKIIIFILALIFITPVVLIAYFIAMYKVIFLSQGLNFVPTLVLIGKKLMKLNEDDDDEDDEDEYNEEDYELENPDDIMILN
jgi:hypothetical protein